VVKPDTGKRSEILLGRAWLRLLGCVIDEAGRPLLSASPVNNVVREKLYIESEMSRTMPFSAAKLGADHASVIVVAEGC
jgi:hypothetical protein